MFDPTAFENLKIVIEGAVYDRDFSGEILVTDRNDIINLAKLERRFEIAFVDKMNPGKKITAIWVLEAKLDNLAAELLPATLSEKIAGCHVTVKFELEHPNEFSIFKNIKKALSEIWGDSRKIDQLIHMLPFENQTKIKNVVTVSFNRLIYEDQIDDLTTMIDFMIKSLRDLSKIIK